MLFKIPIVYDDELVHKVEFRCKFHLNSNPYVLELNVCEPWIFRLILMNFLALFKSFFLVVLQRSIGSFLSLQ